MLPLVITMPKIRSFILDRLDFSKIEPESSVVTFLNYYTSVQNISYSKYFITITCAFYYWQRLKCINQKKFMLALKQKKNCKRNLQQNKAFLFVPVLFSLLANNNESHYRVFWKSACVPSVFHCCEFCCIWPWCR